MEGSNDPSNVIELTINEHAAWHYELWVYYGHWEDYIAWKGLQGLLPKAEIHRLRNIENGKSRLGSKQPQSQKDKVAKKLSKEWTFIDPTGNVRNITNLHAFCRENGLDQGNMVKVAQGKIPSNKGWRKLNTT